jgi:Raf kinase inhibitor-like YbhB/YbcL family protein
MRRIMKKYIVTLFAFLFIKNCVLAQQIEFALWSDTINDGQTLPLYHVYDHFGCGGKNVSPQLRWSGAPTGTKSFAISMFDPDAGSKGWWHWMVLNIPVDVNAIRDDAGNPKNKRLPTGAVQIKNDFGAQGYSGACPSEGGNTHRYRFNVYALDVETLPAREDSNTSEVKALLDKHTIQVQTITTTYKR